MSSSTAHHPALKDCPHCSRLSDAALVSLPWIPYRRARKHLQPHILSTTTQLSASRQYYFFSLSCMLGRCNRCSHILCRRTDPLQGVPSHKPQCCVHGSLLGQDHTWIPLRTHTGTQRTGGAVQTALVSCLPPRRTQHVVGSGHVAMMLPWHGGLMETSWSWEIE